MLYVSVTEQIATLFLDVVTYLFSYFEKLATIKCSHFAEANIIRTTQAPTAITFVLFIDRHYNYPLYSSISRWVTVVMFISVIQRGTSQTDGQTGVTR
jgi:hypothetical protein